MTTIATLASGKTVTLNGYYASCKQVERAHNAVCPRCERIKAGMIVTLRYVSEQFYSTFTGR